MVEITLRVAVGQKTATAKVRVAEIDWLNAGHLQEGGSHGFAEPYPDPDYALKVALNARQRAAALDRITDQLRLGVEHLAIAYRLGGPPLSESNHPGDRRSLLKRFARRLAGFFIHKAR